MAELEIDDYSAVYYCPVFNTLVVICSVAGMKHRPDLIYVGEF